jgi:glycosyltransferase involved in cell wall biosynthesis
MIPTDGTRPLVSAIIPTRNRAALLRETLDSVTSQTGQGDLFDLETIVVDDASTDDTPAVVGAYPVRYIRHEVNRGVGGARNTGIAASRGQYVAFLDDDDVWLPTKVTAVVQAFGRVPADVVYHWWQHMDASGRPLPRIRRPTYQGDVYRALLAADFLSPCSVAIKRECLERVGGFDATLRQNEDWDLWLRLARHYSFGYIPEVLTRIRRLPGSLSGNLDEQLRGAEATLNKAFAADPAIGDAKNASFRDLYRVFAGAYLARGNRQRSVLVLAQSVRLQREQLVRPGYCFALANAVLRAAMDLAPDTRPAMTRKVAGVFVDAFRQALEGPDVPADARDQRRAIWGTLWVALSWFHALRARQWGPAFHCLVQSVRVNPLGLPEIAYRTCRGGLRVVMTRASLGVPVKTSDGAGRQR